MGLDSREIKRWKFGWKPRAVWFKAIEKYPSIDKKELLDIYLNQCGTFKWEKIFGPIWDKFKPLHTHNKSATMKSGA